MAGMVIVRDQKPEHALVSLDGCVFVNCSFVNCKFEYKGGQLPGMFHCAIVSPDGQQMDAKKFTEKQLGCVIFGTDRFASIPTQLLVYLKSWEIEEQVHGSADAGEHCLISTVCYDFFVDGNWQLDLRTHVRQFGTNHDTDPIQITTPDTGDYRGPFPVDLFDDAVIAFYRSKVGPVGDIMNLRGGTHIENFGIQPTPSTVAIPIPQEAEPCGGWLSDGIRRWRQRGERPAGTTPLGEVRHLDP
jgi:hypothetical protein